MWQLQGGGRPTPGFPGLGGSSAAGGAAQGAEQQRPGDGSQRSPPALQPSMAGFTRRGPAARWPPAVFPEPRCPSTPGAAQLQDVQ